VRIVQVIDSLRVAGGAERLQRLFAEAVSDLDVELTIVTLRESQPDAVAPIESLGVRVVAFPSRGFLSPTRAVRLLRFLRREAFDVIHTHLVRATILGVIAGRIASIPTVATLHNTRRNRRLRDGVRIAESRVLRHVADRVVAVGWETARAHRARLGGRPIEVIPNAVGEACSLSESERDVVRRELGVGADELLVIAVGRLHPQKAFGVLLRALQLVLEDGHPVQLRIAGGGPLEGTLRREVEQLGLGERVQLLGIRGDVPRLLAASDVYASSAAWEGLPIATLEAMAAGLPIAATAVGDVTNVVDSGCGILVPPGRPEALARALSRLLGDPALRLALGEAARARARVDYGVEVWARRLLALYEGLRPAPRGSAPAGVVRGRRCV
jgi:glycosyltransferase involved in cell wall biosynthesis